MMGLEYFSKQVYTFQDYNSLMDVLQKTKAENYQVFQNESIIEYTFNRKQWVRLSNIIYWIKIKFIRLHFGQLLDLFENLILYVQNISLQGIKHNYLDCNRIWLKLKSESEYPSMVHSKLLYDERKDSQFQSDQIRIQNIILEIIQDFINTTIGLVKKDKQKTDELNIYNQLKQQLENQNLNDSINEIKMIKQKYKFNEQTQMLSFDKETGNYATSSRRKRVDDVKKQLNYILQQLIKNQNQRIIEEIFNKSINLFNHQLNQNKVYQPSVIHVEQIIQDLITNLIQKQNEFKTQLRQIINKKLLIHIEYCQNNFKFDFSQSEITDMENDIFDVIMNKKVLAYFVNSYWLNKQNDSIQLEVEILDELYSGLIQERFQLSLQIKILNSTFECI